MAILYDWKHTHCSDCLIYKKLSEIYPSEYYTVANEWGHLQIYRKSNHENISHEIANIIIVIEIIKELEYHA
jgi:hypothetical protein